MYLPLPPTRLPPAKPLGNFSWKQPSANDDSASATNSRAAKWPPPPPFTPVVPSSHPHDSKPTFLKSIATSLSRAWQTSPHNEKLPSSGLRVRQVSFMTKRDSAMQDQNATIGAVVGVLLSAFFVVLCYFLHRYRSSIRFSRKKKKKRRQGRGSGSGSSKGSQASSDGGALPAGA
ncbi:hypothetical protein B0H63DRAFT_480504 [Podospora didyma]|uniref:Uncharacterized protein n=1 Tax=Podospora didyma TaxID=330526 RepID=A0AAE0KE76_9PEZI|nr:hypothetical protein B0H63DRAFT_480504 [Podospora didyma]